MSRFVLALDQGTTSSRAILFDHAGRPAHIAQREFAQHFPRPGWVEHDADEIWQSQRQVIGEVIERVGIDGKQLAGIGITNQRETTVIWDRKTGNPIHRAIVWQDRRTADRCQKLCAAGVDELVREKTGLLLDAYFSATKIAWLLDHVPDARQRAERGELCFGTVDSWLIWKLTGGAVHATDITNASRTMLMNLDTGEWDNQLLEMFDVPRSILPRIVAGSGSIGQTAVDDLPKGVSIAGCAGDQQAALFGQLCTRPGMVKCTYGTGCFLLMHTGTERHDSQHQLLTTRAATADPRRSAYALEGAIFVGGAALQWLRDGLGLFDSYDEAQQLAEQVQDAGGVCFVPALTGLAAPHWDADARGLLIGITRGTDRRHVARAAIESMAFQVADVVDAMRADAGHPVVELRVDGGATANDMLMQFQADLLQTPVVRPQVTETTALGAAYLAGLATGFWADPDELRGQWQIDRRFEPQRSDDELQTHRARWAEAVKRARGWA